MSYDAFLHNEWAKAIEPGTIGDRDRGEIDGNQGFDQLDDASLIGIDENRIDPSAKESPTPMQFGVLGLHRRRHRTRFEHSPRHGPPRTR